MKELGDLIRSARQRRGISLEQAAADTRIRRAFLEAIEDGDFRILPGAAYATGFLRNYATYLGLNPDEILQTYHAISPPTGITINPATTVGVERLRRRSHRRMLWSAVTVCLLVLGIYAIRAYSGNQAPAAARPPGTPHSTPVPQPNDGHGARDADQAPTHLVHVKAVISVHAVDTAWLRVLRDGHQIYWGPVHAGSSLTWEGHDLKMVTSRGPAFKVWVDGTRAWRVSKTQGKVRLVAGPYTWHRGH